MSVTITTLPPPLPQATTAKAPVAKPAQAPRDTSLIDAWETTRRDMQEKFLNDRLDMVDKVRGALRPLLGTAMALPGGLGARPMANLLDGLSRELRGIMRDMGQELNRQRGVAGREVSGGFHGLLEKAENSLKGTTGMVLLVGSSDAKPPLAGRMSAREIAAGTADHLLGAWNDLNGLRSAFGGLKVPRVNITA